MSCCSDTKEKEVASSCCSSEQAEVTESSCCSSEQETASDCCSSNDESLVQITPSKASSCSSEQEATLDCCSSNDESLVQITPSKAGSIDSGSNGEPENDASCCSSNEEVSESKKDLLQNSSEQIDFKMYGMDCPSCASTIEKGLERLTNVISASVSYNTEKLQLVVADGYSMPEVEGTIKKLGFTAEPMNKNKHLHTYNLEGMDCGSCAKSIENHLIKISGVNQVNVSFALGNMKVDHTLSHNEIIKEVAKLGFQAKSEARETESGAPSRNNEEILKVVASGVLIATGFIGTYTGLPEIISIILFALALIISGAQPIKSAYYAVKSRSLDMNVLMSTAAIGAALIGEWFEGATVVWLFSLGIFLQNKSMDQTRKSIRNLMNMAPSMAFVKLGNEFVERPVEEITIGQTIMVKPGDKIPLDGKIFSGESSINQAPITGESLPVDKSLGDDVYAGTLNESGALEVEVTKLVEDTTLSKIIHLVEEAQEEKAPTEAFIDRFASIYTPIVFALALIVIVIPPVLGFGTWGEWIYKGLALLVVACPCALVISTPVAIVSAIGNAAKNGVLIKGGTFLEIAGKINAVAFDKTGTLTEGKPQVAKVYPMGIAETDLLSIAHTLEAHSTHPIAKTIVDYAKVKNIPTLAGTSFKNIAGKGVEATIESEVYYAGNPKLFKEMNVSFKEVDTLLNDMQEHGMTIIIIGTEEKIMGLISVTDTIRETSIDTLDNLETVGMKEIVMLTGDNEGTARLIAEKTSITRYFAELLPEDKVTALKQLQKEGNQVAMVGDGINDAPALATADLGIAMGGTGTDTAMETADVVLMADNLEKLPYTVKLSRKAITIIKQNIWFSLIIKFVALILIFPGWLTLWMAVLSDTGAAIIVILNALRLLNVKDK